MASKVNEFHLFAIDPGGVTGWAWFQVNYRAFSRPENKILANVEDWDCGELAGSEHQQLQTLSEMFRERHFSPPPFNSRVDVVSEDFDLVQTIGGKNLLSPVRINAVLSWICAQQGVGFSLQRRTMRTSVTPTRLELFGFQGPWRTQGKGKDMFAAMQHGIVWLRRLKEESKRHPWKLSDNISHNALWDCRCNAMRKGVRVRTGKQCDLVHPK